VVTPLDPASGAAHPGPRTARLPRAMAGAIVAQARAEYPNESCGIVIGSGVVAEGGEALRYAPCRNAAASPYRYVIDSQEALRLSIEADDAGQEFWAIVHSHVRSPAAPSPTDVGLAFWPDALYVLVSLAEEEAGPDGAPSVRAWRIRDGGAFEVALELA
jgi:[CysO sulfur-carrier protein]-S-L-cysteine hydrolase